MLLARCVTRANSKKKTDLQQFYFHLELNSRNFEIIPNFREKRRLKLCSTLTNANVHSKSIVHSFASISCRFSNSIWKCAVIYLQLVCWTKACHFYDIKGLIQHFELTVYNVQSNPLCDRRWNDMFTACCCCQFRMFTSITFALLCKYCP